MRFIGFFIFVFALSILPTLAQEQSFGVSDDIIQSYPIPDVQPLLVQDDIIYDRIYRKVEGRLVFHDAPAGSVTNDLGVGYNYITLSDTANEWARTNSGKWLRASQLSENTLASRFAGVKLPSEGLPYTMAWTLRHLRASTVPGGDASADNPFLYRYTRVNIYETVTIDGYQWYQIGDNQWVHQFNVAKITPVAPPSDVNTTKWVGIDLYEQTLIAYEGTTPVFATLVSSGLSEWSTNEGIFNVYLRRERTTMSGAYNQPDFYYLEEVPWTMFFDDDIALHGTYWHDGFGYRQSHGCVNLSITDAHWLFNWSSDVRDFSVENSPDLSVYVYSSGEY